MRRERSGTPITKRAIMQNSSIRLTDQVVSLTRMLDDEISTRDSHFRSIYRAFAPFLFALRQVVTIILAGTAFTWLLRLLIERNPTQGQWTLQVMLAIGALLAALWDVFYRRQHWGLPLNRLKHLLSA